MPPSGAALAEQNRPRLALVEPPPPRVVDVALWYGERSGGIRTYLDAKVAWAARAGAVEHHLVVPGREHRSDGSRHEVRALTVVAANGYRIPFGTRSLERKLLELRPELLLVHDPFWSLPAAARVGRELDVPVVAVAHSSAMLEAAGLPGPAPLYTRGLAAWRRSAYARADAVLSASQAVAGARRVLPLRFGVDACFRPRPDIPRGDHVLYAGRLSREKGVLDLLAAAAMARDRWPLRIVGSGPLLGTLERMARRPELARRVTFAPFLTGREDLAEEYARAACVAVPGRFETFGLTAFEAAACGTSVVAAETAPAAAAVPERVTTFTAGDAGALLAAIETARTKRPPQAHASRSRSWDAAFESELRDLRWLLR